MAYTQQDLLDAGVHFGHLTRKWNPKMASYIFMEQNGIHIIDLKKTESKLEEAKAAARNIAKSGRRILFVATKKQAKEMPMKPIENWVYHCNTMPAISGINNRMRGAFFQTGTWVRCGIMFQNSDTFVCLFRDFYGKSGCFIPSNW
jgi:ribosomal protein S2